MVGPALGSSAPARGEHTRVDPAEVTRMARAGAQSTWREAGPHGPASLERGRIQGDSLDKGREGFSGILLQSAMRSCGEDGDKFFPELHRNRTRGNTHKVQHRTHLPAFREKSSPCRWLDTGSTNLCHCHPQRQAKHDWTRQEKPDLNLVLL